MKKSGIIFCVAAGLFTTGYVLGFEHGSTRQDPPGAASVNTTISDTASEIMSDELLIRHQLFGENYVTIPFMPEEPETGRDEGIEL
ncbi:hypothetical protein A3E39_01840 [Candidatus Uhrbacteria bacterium RIFCSPHIGHO2_12_FULL_60_25]|uniref:Uncharacterized protein n=1 Tax=Candidatus Uhrbacteria bacterium RIFCSPHIGHO2_12_FULL_60_25 TaxID=1802399 RepID=A0A1F7UN84_9BACT|nr:MAG: hypothetical protein A3D73_02515 [Candidatus Uhrbacteria bacterium RIFCSPHIGHO2_02_FULL_60_44]OGL79751.1 MAG: hypothetical protein A3E39_01840 [Candidatus Uhrbacteria bacterium RIFCSPHIGHO2_12_FULL_60_25]